MTGVARRIYASIRSDPLTFDDITTMTDPPLIAVEIPSALQSQQEMVEKIQKMLQAGVKSCWLVQPTIRAVTVFWNDRERKTVTEGTLTDPVTTDITVEINDVFPA